MATAASTFSSYDRSTSNGSDDPTLSTPKRQSFTVNTNSNPPRPGQHLDDADLLAWKRQYANIGLREQNMMSNSADDLSQLVDRVPYEFDVFARDYNDIDDDELHLDGGNNYDYEAVIQDRLKKANEEFEHDDTPVEIKHRQRVSFDANVKAVDIVRDPQEYNNSVPSSRPIVSPVVEETPSVPTSSHTNKSQHEYTVPLNDTQHREGPTFLEQLKAMQFHGVQPVGDRWSTTQPTTTNDSSTEEDNHPSSKLNPNHQIDTPEKSDSTKNSSSLNSMLVSINGQFQLQNEDDYTAKRSLRFNDENDDQKSSTTNTKAEYIPAPPKEPKPRQDASKPQPSGRAYPTLTRPKSSDSAKRSDNFNSTTSKSWSDNKNNTTTKNQQRPKSAGVSTSLQPFFMRPSAGVNFDELNRKAAERKRAELREENRKKQEEKEKRDIALEKAKESFEKWVRDKDAERRRLNEEKRMEKEEQEVLEKESKEKLEAEREQKYKEWTERKNRDVLIANEFRKLQAEDEEASGGSSSSIHNSRKESNKAFNRWLRQKYEQSREEQRQVRLETRRLRRRQRRSIKRFQLHQDLQLAKSFGYS